MSKIQNTKVIRQYYGLVWTHLMFQYFETVVEIKEITDEISNINRDKKTKTPRSRFGHNKGLIFNTLSKSWVIFQILT